MDSGVPAEPGVPLGKIFLDQERGRMARKDWKERAKKIRLLLLDVDGVMTDGRLGFDGEGREFKFFYARDGIGIKLLQQAGLRVGILSGRRARVVALRAKELGIFLVRQKIKDKAQAFGEILEAEKLRPEQVCYMGDDLVDLPVLCRAGFAVAVADAVAEVKSAAHWVTRSPGGRGAVREVCEKILKMQGKWKKGTRKFFPSPGG
ncbi:MAG: 3-deoxy-D-manno-octulosonate 8-phosphate phosphatase [Deltaproteobacteria bacterium]|nr:3-deoxy-D-manno-octulosonate 8-phosphate phosphatase [Deltaproteobacteria bacterium]